MAVTVVVGCQWGDEGKGKIVDLLAGHSDVVARYQGGANAGHTVVRGDRTFVLHLIPTGALHPGVQCVLGSGLVVDPQRLLDEAAELARAGIELAGRLKVSGAAHVILPYHGLLDAWRERRAERPVGTTLRGIGPAYTEKAGRRGIRIADLLDPERLTRLVAVQREEAARMIGSDAELPAAADVAGRLAALGREIEPWIADVPKLMDEAIRAGRRVILEGAQGTMLDLDHGTYPFVTSSNSVAGGACTGLGIGPTRIDSALGVTKAYSTRVGAGPFPTEDGGERGSALRKVGGEFGATTGRPRRCGWLDFVVLRYAVRVNGLDSLVVTKLDVLDELETIPVAVAYDTPAGRVHDLPSDMRLIENAIPVYEAHEGWLASTRSARKLSDLPTAARRYLETIERECRVPISMVSVGSDAEETIWNSPQSV
jgi:adenylosuccinate synthase